MREAVGLRGSSGGGLAGAGGKEKESSEQRELSSKTPCNLKSIPK